MYNFLVTSGNKTKFKIQSIFFGLILSLIVFSLGEMLIQRDAIHVHGLVDEKIRSIGLGATQEIQRFILEGMYTAQSLGKLLESDNFNTGKFDSWGQMFTDIADTPIYMNIAPGGIISDTFPDNSSAIGINLIEDHRRNLSSSKTIESRNIQFIGPVELISNGKIAVIARYPIFEVDEFWGFSSVVIYIEDIVAEAFSIIKDGDLYFKLVSYDSDNNSSVLFQSEDFNSDSTVELLINVPNGKWTLEISHDPIKNRIYKIMRICKLLIIIVLFVGTYRGRLKVYNKLEEISALNERLCQMSMEDELTGVANRKAGIKDLNSLIAGVHINEKKLSIILLDIDRFKNINDKYGHQLGDDYLKYLVSLLETSVRNSDIIIRQGGDEFLILLPETNRADAVNVASKIMKLTTDNPLRIKGVNIPICLSMGVVEYNDELDGDELLIKADKMLYEAKHDGRGCIKY